MAAQTLNYGTPIAGDGPSGDYATLQIEAIGNGDDWRFTLDAGDLSTLLGSSGSFIGGLAVDVGDTSVNFGSGLALDVDDGGGVLTVEAVNGGGPGGGYDFRIDLGGGKDRLMSLESVTWTWLDSGFSSLGSIALHVQGLEGNPNGYSGSLWVGATPPIPEPGSIALMLAGMVGMGAVMRRRAQPGA